MEDRNFGALAGVYGSGGADDSRRASRREPLGAEDEAGVPEGLALSAYDMGPCGYALLRTTHYSSRNARPSRLPTADLSDAVVLEKPMVTVLCHRRGDLAP